MIDHWFPRRGRAPVESGRRRTAGAGKLRRGVSGKRGREDPGAPPADLAIADGGREGDFGSISYVAQNSAFPTSWIATSHRINARRITVGVNVPLGVRGIGQ